MANYFMGIDAGTGSVRVAIFNDQGRIMAYDVKDYPSYYPKSGWAEPNLTPPPLRDFCPFIPRPAVVPRPEAVPRPFLLRFLVDPSTALIS